MLFATKENNAIRHIISVMNLTIKEIKPIYYNKVEINSIIFRERRRLIWEST